MKAEKLVIELQTPEKDNNGANWNSKCNNTNPGGTSGDSCNALTSHNTSSSSTNNTGSDSINDRDTGKIFVLCHILTC